MIRKADGRSRIEAHGEDNPVIDSYQALWNDLKDARERGSSQGAQNTMRVILEWYFGFLGDTSWERSICARFEDYRDRSVVYSLLCWVNDGSHRRRDDLFAPASQEDLQRQFCLFKKIFEEVGHLAHYQMMMGETEE